MQIPIKQILFRFITLFSMTMLLISCQLLPMTEESLIEPTQATQFELPEAFQTSLLNSLDIPHSYLSETCRSMRNKWNPLKAKPGTVVMVIRFDSINSGTADLPNSITLVEFGELMNQLKSQGFEAIRTKDLLGFLEQNEVIPERSIYLIQTGNHDAEYYDKIFQGYWHKWGWKITNAWISEPNISETLLLENIELENEGFIEHEAGGVFADAQLSDESAKNIIARELQGSWNGVTEEFGKSPVAIIWPNGGFGFRPVEAARQLGFKIGFTANTRGPIMYNWIPLADIFDPQRPEYVPEGLINDPLMTLPTYSAGEALMAIDAVRIIGEEAANYAQANKEAEFQYYEAVCEPEYSPIPSP